MTRCRTINIIAIYAIAITSIISLIIVLMMLFAHVRSVGSVPISRVQQWSMDTAWTGGWNYIKTIQYENR